MNIVYNASAGTGKTYQVTNLYAGLVLDQGIDPRKILLMTFTENAAEELRIRVTQQLIKTRRQAEDKNDDETATRAAGALFRLPSAPICTIHAYCTRLLREHALEAGLSPRFAVMEGPVRDELLEQIARDELLGRLDPQSADIDSDLADFCAGAHVIGNSGFGSSITETVPNLIAQADSLGISLENAEAMLPDPKPSGSLPAFESIFKRLEELPKLTADAQKVCQCLEANLPKVGNVEELAKTLMGAGLKKFGRGKDQKPISDDFWELLGAVNDAIKYRGRFPAAKAFARYVQAVVRAFQHRKHEMDCVDFDDLLLMAHRLLQNGVVAPNFSHVIIDEVQDTSRIQCDIIQSLWKKVGTDRRAVRESVKNGGLGDAALPIETSLVICGDKKQSIYTWRGADPQVMPDLEKLIAARGNSETRPLQTSYRSKAPILDVVNKIFEQVYGAEEYTGTDCLKANEAFKTKNEKPCVEFLATDEAELSKQEKVAAEMQAVAERIQLLVKGSNDWKPVFRYSEDSSGFLPVSGTNDFRYSDILILLRRTTHQEALEHALRQAGVPYTVGGKGTGLFSQQETRDVSLFLNVLADPTDILSLIGFLRSPWIGMSDEAIAELAWREDGFSGENLQECFAGNADRTGCPAHELIARYRALMGSKLASELVRMLIDETGYDAVLAGLPRGTQRLANLRKVIDWLRENERGGRVVPAMAARRLRAQIENPPPVPQAALLDPEQNAVTLMTVHGAKGLTKRVVFLPDISFRPKNDTGFAYVFHDAEGRPSLGLRINAPDRDSVLSPGFQYARDRAAAVRAHELKNLFYVAMTRARDLVVLSASSGKTAGGWLKDLEPFIANGKLPSRGYSDISAAAAEQQVRAGYETAAIPMVDPSADGFPMIGNTSPFPKAQVRRIPATRLAKQTERFEEAPDQWAREADLPAIKRPESAAALGSLGHAVLEQLALNRWQGSAEEWIDVLRLEFDVVADAAAEIAERVNKTVGLMIGQTAEMDELIPELPFVMRTEQDGGILIIDGTIDLLCRRANRFTVFDYKFTEEPASRVAETYARQMQIYHQAVKQAYPLAEAVAICLVIVSIDGSEPHLMSI